MSVLFRKLKVKEQTDITVLNAPHSFDAKLMRLDGVDVRRSLTRDASRALTAAGKKRTAPK